MRSGKTPKTVMVVVVAVVVCALVYGWSKSGSYQRLKSALQVQEVPTGMLRYGPLGKLLLRNGYIGHATNDFERYKRTAAVDDLETVTFQKKRQVDDFLYRAIPGGNRQYRSTAFLEEIEPKPDWPVISIAIDEKHFSDPQHGLMPNREKSGPQWEKVVEVSYLENGQVLFETSAGLRMHGGKRLVTQKWQPGFKLYFRGRYGLPQVPEGLILPDLPVPLRTLVLQNTVWPPGYPMNNPLSYDISRQIGCEAPRTRLLEVYINGRSYGMSIAMEHLSRRQWGQRYEGQDYSLYKFRNLNRPSDEHVFNRYFWQPVTAGADFSRDLVARTINLDNFSRHVFAWVFNATDDFCQGVAYYPFGVEEPKVNWIHWDMDQSFYDYPAVTHQLSRKNWEQEAFRRIFRDHSNCDRVILFTRLMRESEEYRREFTALAVELLNHRLTPAFLFERVGYYERMMNQYGTPYPDYIAMLQDFMANRSDFVWKDMQDVFDLGALYPVEVAVPAGVTVLIDDYPCRRDYRGRYFDSTPVKLALPEQQSSRLAYWQVNGARLEDREITVFPDRKTNIEIVLEDGTAR